MPSKRFTIPNPRPSLLQKITYHVPMHWVEEFSMKTFGHNTYMYGELVNKLGKYEDLGEPEELAKRLGIRKDWVK